MTAFPLPGGAVETSVTSDNFKSGLGAVGCWSATSCVAAGDYIDTSGDQHALVVPITNGVPGTPIEIQPPVAPSPNPVNAHPVASLRGLSCLPSGTCVAVGIYHDTAGGYDAFEVTIIDGVPSPSVEIPAPANTASTQVGFLFDVSCQQSGTCVAVGQYTYDNSGDTHAMVVPIANGVPGAASAATSVPGNSDPVQDGWLSNVACPAVGICSAIGGYLEASTGVDRSMVLPITAGVAGQATEVLPPPDSTDTEISDDRGVGCQPTGECVAVGNYTIGGSTAAVAIPINNGVPGAADEIPLTDPSSAPDARLDGVACPAAGTCMAAGGYRDSGGTFHALRVSFDAGTISSETVTQAPADASTTTPFSGLATVGCASASCVLVGSYSRASDGNGNPLVLSAQAPLTIAPTSLPAGGVGSAYSQTLSVSGAWGAYGSWSVESGTLPAGISLNAQTGVIAGTPTAGGTSNFTVQMSATTGTPLQTATQSYSVTIAAAPVTTTTTTTPAPKPVLTLATGSAIVTRNKFGLKLICSAAPCHGSLRLQITETVTVEHGRKKVHRHVTVAIGNAGFSLAAGQAKSIKVTVNAIGRRALAARHRLRVTVLDTLDGAKGTLGHLTLRPAPVKHRH